MRLHERFEWDEEKATSNVVKHGVLFDTAAEALEDDEGDRFHTEEFDEAHSADEDRWVTTASYPVRRSVVLAIVWTTRRYEVGPVTRILSARRVTRSERRVYLDEIRSRPAGQ